MTLGFFTIGLPSASSSIGLPSASSFGSSPFAKESCAAGSSHASSSEPPGAITSVICKLFFKIDGVERERDTERQSGRAWGSERRWRWWRRLLWARPLGCVERSGSECCEGAPHRLCWRRYAAVAGVDRLVY